jgi:hypothetical protein
MTGVRTVEILSYIRRLLTSGEILKRSSLDGQITVIEKELRVLEQSRIIPMGSPLTNAIGSTIPMFGMSHSDFMQYLNDIHDHIQDGFVISLQKLGEVSNLTPSDRNPPQDKDLSALFEWLKSYGCIHEPGGLHTTKLNGIVLKALIEYRKEKGMFPDMPSAPTLPAVKEATTTTGVLELRQKRIYTKCQPKVPVVAVVPVKKARKKHRRSLRQVMAEFDKYFVLPLMQELEEKFHECLALVSTNLGKAKKVFAEIEKLEAKLAMVRSQRDRFDKMMREFIDSLK